MNQKLAAPDAGTWRGCEVEVACNGREAVEFALLRSYALVLMDCQMPEMDGFEATRRVRAALGDYAPPIIAVTARGDPIQGLRQGCLQAGMAGHLRRNLSAPLRSTGLLESAHLNRKHRRTMGREK